VNIPNTNIKKDQIDDQTAEGPAARTRRKERLLLFLLSSALLCFLIPIRKPIEEGHIFAGSIAIVFGSFSAMGFIVASISLISAVLNKITGKYHR
jgi:hypothetical protein